MGEVREYFDRVLEQLTQIGYATSWRLVNCADFGVPQRRMRTFVVGFRWKLAIRWNRPDATHSLEALLDLAC